MSHFELIFMMGMRSVSTFFFFLWHRDIQFFYLFSIIMPLPLCQTSVNYIYVGLLLWYLLYFIDLFIFFFHQYHNLVYCGFTVSPEGRQCKTSFYKTSLFISFNYELAILGPLPLHINFRINLLICTN